ncbi:hypothetical protein VPNG_05738 [Cytospora leucostoma]|uniref:Uncharacterized protein n=1 Tax=Cytospora leucostoma TaxID=1230097 RepID=A0A423X070_9PEZI|nr:hypothetical protein VPNG_05738 [Cytospora leucostoma]
MGGLDPDIANGTCYYAYNEAAGSELVPCGNAGIADVPCCFAGDYCDSSNTCYDKDTGNTYLAGCTDPEYTSSSCPWKSDDFASQEWVGLVRCDDAVNETQDEWAWAGCSVPESAYTSLRRLGDCDCDGKATLFVDEQALLRHASLPGSVGGSISWVSGYEVTAAAASTRTSAAGTRSTTASATATAGSTAGAGTAAASSSSPTGAVVVGQANSSSGSLSAGAKAGIAVGSVGAVLSVLAVAVAVFLHRRRRRGSNNGGGGGGGNAGGVDGYSPVAAAAPPGGQVVAAEQAGGMIAPPAYTGFKTELPADESVVPKGAQAQTPSPLLLGVTPELGSSEFRGSAPSMVSELSSDEGADRSRLNSPVYPTLVSIAELEG